MSDTDWFFNDIEFDDEDIENSDLVDTFDPSVYDDITEMVQEYEDDIFYTTGKIGDQYWVEEKWSQDITDQIDWDSLDYE